MGFKKTVFAFLSVLFSVASISPFTSFWAIAQTEDTSRTKVQNESEHQSEAEIEVMILGTLHLTGGGKDAVNSKVQDYLTPKGQEEIRQVLDHLQSFEPDKIMLELDLEHEDAFNEKYKAYLQGKHKLSVNERQQFGMRLAKRLGHERLYAIDFDSFLDYRPALAAANELGQEHLLKQIDGLTDQIRATIDAEEGLSLIEILARINADDQKLQRKIFLAIAQMGTVEDPQGALQILTWWQRNMVIFARAAQYAKPGDKILIVFGSGHKDILEEFFRDAPGFKLVSPLPYLK